MGYRHSQDELLRAAVGVALESGMAGLPFGGVGDRLGISGLASTGRPPYVELAPRIVAGWVDWLEPRMLGSNATIRRRRALATLAYIDGLLLVRQVLGPEAAEDAAREAGVAR